MRQYYYTVATLPYLHPDSPPPFRSAELMDFYSGQLQPDDLDVIRNCSLTREKTAGPVTPVLARWYSWEKNLRNELVLLRSKIKKIEGEKFCEPVDEYIADAKKAAFTAFSSDDPFVAEEILSRARWSFLDECEVGHLFDVEKLIIYFLKLLLLERRASFNRDRGNERIDLIMSRFEETFSSKRETVWKK